MARTEQPKTPHLHEPFRQHMLEEAPQKFVRGDGAGPATFGHPIPIPEGDGVVRGGDDPVVGEWTTRHIRGHILQGGVPIPHGSAIDDPGLGPHVRWDLVSELELPQGRTEFGPEQDGKRFHRYQKGRVGGADDRPIRRVTHGWHEVMDMGMVAQIAGPGLENAKQADLPTQEAGISGKLLERGGGGTKQDGVQAA